MEKSLSKGQLVKWNDDRGFGFIKPTDGKEEIFLHISEIKTTGRRPKIGDVVFYALGTGKNGKTCAVSASIQGVASASTSSSKNKAVAAIHKPSKSILPQLIIGFIGLGIGITSVVVLAPSQFSRLFNFPFNLPFTPKASNLVSASKTSNPVSAPKTSNPVSAPKTSNPVVAPKVTPVSKSKVTPVSEPIVINEPVAQQNCNIKGNISVSSGNKLYHVAGMEDYEGTIIDPSKGEKWFCSESEAIAAGWRRAPR
jgi:cold shock CspA family protein